MATTCTYRAPDTAPCPDPATHVTRCRWDQLGVWNVFAEEHTPDFCLTHADVVSAQRQARWKEAVRG